MIDAKFYGVDGGLNVVDAGLNEIDAKLYVVDAGLNGIDTKHYRVNGGLKRDRRRANWGYYDVSRKHLKKTLPTHKQVFDPFQFHHPNYVNIFYLNTIITKQ